MAWFKVDDKLHSHPKWMRISKGAKALWVTAGSWSSDQMTDGAIPKYMLKYLHGLPREAAELVTAGLWDVTEDGWEFRSWTEYQPSREQIEARRQQNSRRAELHRDKELTRMVRHRDRDVCRYCGTHVDFMARRGPLRGTYDHIDPKGPNTMENLVVACGPCNSSKCDRPLSEWRGGTLLPPPGS